MDNTVARMANSVAVDMGMSYKRRRLEAPLNRCCHMGLRGSGSLISWNTGSAMLRQPRF
jgi:hypothetical protein